MKKHTWLMIGLATLVVTGTQASQEQLAKSIQEARAETARTSEQLKATLSALKALAQQTNGDLHPAYNAFCTEVADTVSAAATTAARAQWMDGEDQQYFKDWQNTIIGIANASLRKKSQMRLEAVRASLGKVGTDLKEASAQFKPFLSDLSDIEKTLAADVTAAGVKAVRSTIKSANRNHQAVDRAISSAIKEMEKMEKSLSSEAQ